MYYNYRIEKLAYEEPTAILFTSATRKKGHSSLASVGLSWDSPHPPPESVRTDGRTDGRTDVRTLTSEPKFFGSTGYQICLPMVLRELCYNTGYKIKRNYLQARNAFIVKQILPGCSKRNVWNPLWRIC